MRRKVEVSIPVETFHQLTQLAENLNDKTVEVVNSVPEQRSMAIFLAEYARTGYVRVARDLAGLSKTTYYRYQRRNPEFKRQCDEIKIRLQAELENEKEAQTRHRMVSLAQHLKDVAGELLVATERHTSGGGNDDEL